MRGISVLGSTGSIGTQTLDVIRRNKDIKVVALAAGQKGYKKSRKMFQNASKVLLSRHFGVR